MGSIKFITMRSLMKSLREYKTVWLFLITYCPNITDFQMSTNQDYLCHEMYWLKWNILRKFWIIYCSNITDFQISTSQDYSGHEMY